MKKIKLIHILILLLISQSFYSQLIDNPYSEDFSRGNGIWNGDLSYSSYSGYYNECTGNYMASENVWSNTGDVEFETLAHCGQTLGGDVTISITYQANDYNDSNIPIGPPEFPSLKIYTKNSIADSWTIRSTITPAVSFCQIADVTYSTMSGDEVWVKIVFAWGSGDWIVSLDRVDITEASSGLPITLVSFDGEVLLEMDPVVLLEWTVASQTNNDYFTIEKSKNLSEWSLVDNINGSGTTNMELRYSLVDDNPFKGISYYRLKQTDHNGESKTFYPIAIEVKGDKKHIIKTINLQGNEIDSTKKGFMIHVWNDGTVTKVVK